MQPASWRAGELRGGPEAPGRPGAEAPSPKSLALGCFARRSIAGAVGVDPGHRRVRGRRVQRRQFKRVRRLVALGLALLVLARGARGEDQLSASEEGQVLVFLKVMTYDRVLADADVETIHICVLYARGDSESEAAQDRVRQALADNAGKTVNGKAYRFSVLPFTSADALEEKLRREDVHALYIARGLDRHLGSITAAARRRCALTMTGVPEYVSQGVSVGLALREGKPRILLNLSAVRAEGHAMSANLLRLCEVIR